MGRPEREPQRRRPRLGDAAAFALVAAATVLTRVPFLSASSLGGDSDASRVGLAARHIAETGEYVASRFPGYPVHEIGSALGWAGGLLALNALTALFSGIAAGFVGLVLRRLGVRAWGLGALAFACVPVVYLSSVVAMDYVWSVAGIAGAVYFGLRMESVIAGMLLGLAVGARLTAGAMLLPLGWLLGHDGPRPVRRFSVAAFGTAALCYLPSLWTYGLGFLRFSDGAQSLRIVLHQGTLEVWGVAGFFSLAGAVVFVLLNRRSLSAWERRVEQALLGGTALFAASYFRLPLEAGYLVPTVPLVLVWLGLHLPHRSFVALCLALVASPFVLDLEADSSLPPRALEPALPIRVGGAEMRLLPLGPLFTERARAEAEADRLRALAEAAQRVSCPAVVLAGGVWSRLAVALGEAGRGLVLVDSLGVLEAGRSAEPLSQTWPLPDSLRHLPVYVLPGVAPPPPDDPSLYGRTLHAMP